MKKLALCLAALLIISVLPATAAELTTMALFSNSDGEYAFYEMTNNGTAHAVNAIAGSTHMSPFGRVAAAQSILEAAFDRGQMALISTAPAGTTVFVILENEDLGIITLHEGQSASVYVSMLLTQHISTKALLEL